jgi:hypothetical protein
MSVTEPHTPTGQQDHSAAQRFVAHVLRDAHRTADTYDEPDEARAIFHMAVSFASEMEQADPEFDRLAFIKAATGL